MKGDLRTISILGTGDYGRALAKRFNHHGFKVICGSRNPGTRDLVSIDTELHSVVVTHIPECIKMSNVVFLAVPSTAWDSVLKPHESLLKEKILVDVSNKRLLKTQKESNAERLAEMLPSSQVVKGFNTISAYALEYDHSVGSRTVYICGDHSQATSHVSRLASEIGFQPIERGGIAMARELERMPFLLLPGWWVPALVSVAMFLLWLGFSIYKEHFFWDYKFSHLPAHTMDKAVASTSITLLSLCYLPGSFASLTQLKNRTKYKRFPGWLDNWLKMRKQLGIFALFFAGVHCILVLVVLQPAYLYYHFENYLKEVRIPANHTTDIFVPIMPKLGWTAEVTVLTGVLTLFTMLTLGISTLPSVGSSLNWREWRFVHSRIGFVCLSLAIVHVIIRGYGYWIKYRLYKVFQHGPLLVSFLPWFTMLLKLLLLLPCFAIPIRRIRHGWEPGRKDVEAVHMDTRNGADNDTILNGNTVIDEANKNTNL